MSAARMLQVARHDLGFQLRRPLLWVLTALVVLQSWGLSTGNVRISSGDATVGGSGEAFITSQFSQAFTLAISVLAIYTFFLTVAAGMAVIRDEENKVGELLHATLLTPGEYVWGKFAAVMAAYLGVLAVHVGSTAFFNHALADAASSEFIGPFAIGNYLVPALAFAVPTLVFLGGTAFAVGEVTRRPILVFVLPVGVLLVTLTFLVSWSPSWLSPTVNRLLMMVDPSGFRWLSETWLRVDRGVDFYNTAPIAFDAGFVVSRAAFLLLGLGAVFVSQRHFARALTGAAGEGASGRWLRRLGAASPLAGFRARWRRPPTVESVAADSAAAGARSLAGLRMARRPVGWIGAAATVARAEIADLVKRPGLYLFVPLIMLQAAGNIVTNVVAFDAPALATPGTMAVQMLNTLSLLVCFLLLFYMVESMQREYSTGLAPIFYATPTRTSAVMFGKALGTSLVGISILAGMLVVCVGILGVQRLAGSPVAVGVMPFLLTWGAVLAPTYVVWCAFVVATYAITGSRYATYAVGIGAIVLTLREILVGDGLTWITNWLGWNAVVWSDMGLFPLNGRTMLWNRAFVLALAVVFVALAVRVFRRRASDPQRTLHRLRPRSLAWTTLTLVPALLVPTAIGVPLWRAVETGFESESEERVRKDYWRRNLATWRDAVDPAIGHVDLDVELEPSRRWFTVEGSYRLVNTQAETMRRFAITPGRWDEVTWSLDGEPFEPEDRAGLQVFERPLTPGEAIEVGFAYEATFPRGASRGGGGASEFVLDAGVVLTSFGPSWVPTVGYLESVGVDDDNRYQPPEYPEDHYAGITPSGFGNEGPPYTTRIRVTSPEEYTVNSVGALVSENTADGRRTVVWESDHPVTFFNLVAGRWDVRRGPGTAIFHHPEHTYNLDEIDSALQASRRYYSEWFYPFPWQELKVSEFPALATYAQGFPTNITFSEGIGFLTKNDPRARTAFLVTAHEAAHQWWGNLLTPGRGPGAGILSEGMSHFSTMLLAEQVHGVGQRIELAKRFESRYADNRQVDSERPLVRIDGSRPGDTTVTYEKGGWVAWMLMDLIGREPMLAGLREFIATFNPSPDHPVLEDLIATLRPHAVDVEAFDAFVDQWFFEVVVPEYRIADARLEAVTADGDPGWRVTATVENVGTGRMPLQVAATSGVRFPELEDEVAADERAADKASEDGAAEEGAFDGAEPYREARVTVTLGAGERTEIEILCDFEPERLVVDPDALVLQLRREQATAELGR